MSDNLIDPIWSLQSEHYIVLVKIKSKCYMKEAFNLQIGNGILKFEADSIIYRYACDEASVYQYIFAGVIDLTTFKLLDIQPIHF